MKHNFALLFCILIASTGCQSTSDMDPGNGADVDAAVDNTPHAEKPASYSGGTCSTFAAGKNQINSANIDRAFNLYLPANPEGAAVIFMWHGAGDSPDNFARWFQADGAATANNAIIVVPQGQGPIGWEVNPAHDMVPDAILFDDILFCLEEQYDIDNDRVSTTGFSSGALWSTFLIISRSQYLATSVIFSGGTDSTGVARYETPDFQIPVVVVWGGENDVYSTYIDFDTTSRAFSNSLFEDSHLVIECNHGLGHTVPSNATQWVYTFLTSHQWGQKSPYADDLGNMPSYCTLKTQ